MSAPPVRAHDKRLSSYSRNSQLYSSTHSRDSRPSSRSHSRPTSGVFPLIHSSLTYALVRDFAYPPFHPKHYGPSPTPSPSRSGQSTPYADTDYERRMSDPEPSFGSSGRGWGAGPWGGDGGAMYESGGQQLPRTSFGDEEGDEFGDEEGYAHSGMKQRHRKSKSYASLEKYGRRRSSGKEGRRKSSRQQGPSQQQEGGGGGGGGVSTGLNSDGFFETPGAAQTEANASQQNQQPANGHVSGTGRRDSHFASTLPNRSYTHSPSPETPSGPDLPFLSSSPSPTTPTSPSQHRPESSSLDETFAGPSLALYTFVPENANELALREGQIIQVGYRHGQGWLVAMDLETGEQGLVPEEYVRLLRDIEGWGEDEEEMGDGDEVGMSGER